MKLLSGTIELKPGWVIQLPYPMTEMEFVRYRFGPLALALPWAIPAGSAIAWGPTLALWGTGIAAAGLLQAGREAEAETQSAQNIANYNAAVMEQEAKARKQKSLYEQQQQAKRATRVKSTLKARIAKAGGLGSPVAADLAAEQAAELELENLLIGYEGEIGAERALSQAKLDRLQGRLYAQKGRAAKKAGYIGAGATLLTGFGTAFL